MNVSRENKTTWLQGIGCVAGKPAGEIRVGDKLMWNYGYTSVVTRILKETAKQVVLEVESSGKLYERRLVKDRIVAIAA